MCNQQGPLDKPIEPTWGHPVPYGITNGDIHPAMIFSGTTQDSRPARVLLHNLIKSTLQRLFLHLDELSRELCWRVIAWRWVKERYGKRANF